MCRARDDKEPDFRRHETKDLRSVDPSYWNSYEKLPRVK